MPRAAIAASKLTKEFGPTTAVDGLDLHIEPGTIYGVLGPNGAGKTTTMWLLAGLIEPTSGQAHVDGTPIENRRDLVEKIGLMPETPPLYGELSGREQLRFAAELRGLQWEVVSDRTFSLAERLGLGSDLGRRIDSYSKGTKQKTAFIQAIQHDPNVAFLDEPTSGLDPRAARIMRECIVDLADRGSTVMLSTHIIPVVEEIADRVGIIHQGRCIDERSPDDLGEEFGDWADLEDVFLELTEHPQRQSGSGWD